MWEAFYKLKLNFDVVVTIVFWANFMNEQTQNNRQRSRFLKIKVQKVNPLKQFGKHWIVDPWIWIVDPFTQVKSAKHMAKFNTKSISNQGTFYNFSLAPGCISKQTMGSAVKKTRLNSSKDDFLMKSFPFSTKRKLSILLNFLFPFFVF